MPPFLQATRRGRRRTLGHGRCAAIELEEGGGGEGGGGGERGGGAGGSDEAYEGSSGSCDRQQCARQKQQQREWHAHGSCTAGGTHKQRHRVGLGGAREHAAVRVCGPQWEWCVPTCGILDRKAPRLCILCACQLERPRRNAMRTSTQRNLRTVSHAGDRDVALRVRGSGVCTMRTRALRAWPRPRSPAPTCALEPWGTHERALNSLHSRQI